MGPRKDKQKASCISLYVCFFKSKIKGNMAKYYDQINGRYMDISCIFLFPVVVHLFEINCKLVSGQEIIIIDQGTKS